MKRTIHVLWPYKKGVWVVGVTDSVNMSCAYHQMLHVRLTKYPQKFRGWKRHKNLRQLVEQAESARCT